MSLPRNGTARLFRNSPRSCASRTPWTRATSRKFAISPLERKGDTYTLWIPEEVGDVSLERESLLKKGTMFTDVLGASVALKQGTPPK